MTHGPCWQNASDSPRNRLPRSDRRSWRRLSEVVVLRQILVDRPRNSGSDRTVDRPPASQQNHYNELVVAGFFVGSEPAQVRGQAIVGTGSGFSEDRVHGVKVGAPGG